jgi:hypothetical protein
VADRDWVRVVAAERCPECGLAASEIGTAELASRFADEAGAWGRLLGGAGPEVLRGRPSTAVWSPLEYAAHVRDVMREFAGRIDRVLHESHPRFGWWDHEAAVLEEDYNGQDPAAVAEGIRANAALMAAALAAAPPDGWSRTGERRDGEVFTAAGLGRFALHEVHHHRRDAGG